MPGSLRRTGKLAAVTLWLGVALFAAGTALHPPEFDPANPLPAIAEGPSPKWVLDHGALCLALLLIGAGLASWHARLFSERAADDSARAFAVVAALFGSSSLTIWILLLSAEATLWPALAKAIHDSGLAASLMSPSRALAMVAKSDPLYVVAAGIWRALLGIGYVAAAMFAAGAIAWGRASHKVGVGPVWTRHAAIWGGVLSLMATPPAWYVPSAAVWLLLPGLGLLGVWMIATGWHLWSGGMGPSRGEN